MIKSLLAFLLFASPVMAQDQAAAARAAAGCGPNEIQFEVRTDKKQHPMGQPEPGKALVYVFGDEAMDNVTIHVGNVTTRVGLDGAWVGANHGKSYFFFPVDPGDHHLCTARQSAFKFQSRISAAVTLTAEPGRIYYFRTKTVEPEDNPREPVRLVPVDPAEAQLLIAYSAFGTSHPKK